MPRIWTIPALLIGLLASVFLTLVPAQAAMAMPSVILTGGAAEVERTYTASTPGYKFASDINLRYQWYRGDHDATSSSYVPISGATGQRYTLRDVDHWNTVKVLVTAMRNGNVAGQRYSSSSNWIMYDVKAPILSGSGLVGHTVTGTLGIWATEWDVTVWWRRGTYIIPNTNSLSYKMKPQDAGKSMSLVGLGEHEFPNGVHPIDRDVTHISCRWGTQAFLSGRSTAPHKLNLVASARAAMAHKVQARGHVVVYSGKRVVKRTFVNGHRTIKLTGLSKGPHKITMLFKRSQSFASTITSRTFVVR